MTSASPVILHFLHTSRADSILWLLEELELEYQLQLHERQLPSGRAPPELKQIHLLGKSPAIQHDGNTVVESGAIVSYLLNPSRFPSAAKFQLPTSASESEDLRNTYFTYYAEGSLMGSLVNKRVLGGLPDALPWIQGEIENHLNFLEHELPSTGYVAGGTTPTAGDFAMYFALQLIANKGRADPLPVPQVIKDYVNQVEAREAFQRGRKRLEQAEKVKEKARE